MDELLRQGLAILRGMWQRRWVGLAVAWIVNVTGLPEAPPVAVTLYVAPPTAALPEGTEVKVIVWPDLLIVTSSLTCGAAL